MFRFTFNNWISNMKNEFLELAFAKAVWIGRWPPRRFGQMSVLLQTQQTLSRSSQLGLQSDWTYEDGKYESYKAFNRGIGPILDYWVSSYPNHPCIKSIYFELLIIQSNNGSPVPLFGIAIRIGIIMANNLDHDLAQRSEFCSINSIRFWLETLV